MVALMMADWVAISQRGSQAAGTEYFSALDAHQIMRTKKATDTHKATRNRRLTAFSNQNTRLLTCQNGHYLIVLKSRLAALYNTPCSECSGRYGAPDAWKSS
jgi:hypothetical protein